jgi:pyruvate, water dikinase
MSTAPRVDKRFPSPFSVPTPPGAEGWESMYPPYLLFSEDNREWEDSVFWFADSLHRPEVEYPFDTIVHEAWNMSAGGFTTRVFTLPAANGVYNRILNGRLYTSTIPVTEEKEVQERVPTFTRRAGFYFEHWNDLFAKWRGKMDAVIDELKAIEVPTLPRVEEEAIVTQGLGFHTGHRLLKAYNDATNNVFLAYQYHFEMLLLGYGAYLNMFQFAQKAFPGISEQAVASMAAGADILFFRPDEELKKLARLALHLGLGDRVRADRQPEQIVEDFRHDPLGRRWVEQFDAVQDPWFYFSTGTGLYHHERSWIDDLTVPWAAMRGYMDRLERGEKIDRPLDAILERRDRLTKEYRDLLASDDDRATFDENVALARMVAPYVEDHNVYIEHRHHTVFWNKMREFGDGMAANGWLEERDDLFYLNRWELGQALYDMTMNWASDWSGPSRARHFKSLVSERKRIVEVLKNWLPEPALGPVPPEINEPFTIMLWGITPERVESWLESEDGGTKELRGVAGSPGVVEGTARVVLSVDQIPLVREGEIMVCPITAPSWGPVFDRIKATVSDLGGIMSHAAIVSREYGLPAVVGTVRGTKLIHTGDRIRVDGGTGVVEVLS